MRSPPSSLALFTFPLGGSAAIAPRSLPDGPNSSPVLPCSHRQFKETVRKFTQEAIAQHAAAIDASICAVGLSYDTHSNLCINQLVSRSRSAAHSGYGFCRGTHTVLTKLVGCYPCVMLLVCSPCAGPARQPGAEAQVSAQGAVLSQICLHYHAHYYYFVNHDGLYSFVFAFSLKLISGEHIGALAMSEPNCQYHFTPIAVL